MLQRRRQLLLPWVAAVKWVSPLTPRTIPWSLKKLVLTVASWAARRSTNTWGSIVVTVVIIIRWMNVISWWLLSSTCYTYQLSSWLWSLHLFGLLQHGRCHPHPRTHTQTKPLLLPERKLQAQGDDLQKIWALIRPHKDLDSRTSLLPDIRPYPRYVMC